MAWGQLAIEAAVWVVLAGAILLFFWLSSRSRD